MIHSTPAGEKWFRIFNTELCSSRILPSGQGNNSLDSTFSGNLYIPDSTPGKLEDIQIGVNPVLSESGNLFFGLDKYIVGDFFGIPSVIVDNHNNILPFLSHAWNTEILPKGVPVVHIDAHSDLWPNAYDISFEQTIQEKDILVFTDTYTTIANYYQPLLRNGSISEVYRYEGEYELLHRSPPSEPFFLNIDLDFFVPEMNHISFSCLESFLASILPGALCITFATSPGFISFSDAKKALLRLLSSQALRNKIEKSSQ